jgi:hypothetical protein
MTMDTSEFNKLLAPYGLTATFIEAEDFESEDAEIRLCREGVHTAFVVQIGLQGYYYVDERGGDIEQGTAWMKLHGEFRSLPSALKHAATLATAAAKGTAP